VEQFWLSQFTKEDLYNAPADFVLEDFIKETSDSIMSSAVIMYSFSKPNTLPRGYEGRDYDKYNLSESDKKILYEKLWQLMEKCGGPKIRPLEDSNWEEGIEKERAHFNSATHTMYINMTRREFVNEEFAAELAHACQHHLKPFEANNKGNIDRIYAGAYAASNMMSFSKAYDELLYDKAGTIENEAHSDIEPKILSFLDNNRKTRVSFDF
jgi:hypothetical protein